jgi:hypothetical protein
MIKEELGVSISTMSYWFSDRPFKPNEEMLTRIRLGSLKNGTLRHNERVEKTKKVIEDAAKDIGKLSKRDLWMLGLGLYIGEGSKSIESVRIVNSDPAVIKIAIRWFREACNLSTDNLIISLNLYPDNDVEESIEYWRLITGLPKSNFRKTQIDTRTQKNQNRRGKLPYGTAQIRVRSNGDTKKGVVLFRKIRGWTKGALDQV